MGLLLSLFISLHVPIRALTIREVYTVDDWNSIEENDHVVLMNDLDFDGVDYRPIPLFSGTIDGQGYTIKNIEILAEDSIFLEDVGLFGQVINATVRDLKIDNMELVSEKFVVRMGSLAGRAEHSDFENISIINTSLTSFDVVGGIVGHLINSNLSDVHVKSMKITGVSSIGGLIGKIEPLDTFSEVIESNTVSISKSSFQGSISGERQIGGLIGSISISTNIHINESFSKGTLNAVENAGFMVGEILTSSLIVSNSYSNMTIQYSYDESFQGNFGWIGSRMGDGSNNHPLMLQNVYQNTSMMGSGIYANQKAWVGGDINGVEPNLNNAYYNQDSLQVLDTGAQSSESLHNKDTYFDFDFDTIWWIDSSINEAYPVLQRETFNVKFHPNNLSDVLSQRFIKETMIITPEVSYEEYTFEAWYTDEALTQCFDETSLVSNDLALYAKWIETLPEEEEVIIDEPVVEEPESDPVIHEPVYVELILDQVVINEVVKEDKPINPTILDNNEINNQTENDEDEIITDAPQKQEVTPESKSEPTPIITKKNCWWWLWLLLAFLGYLVYHLRKSHDMVQ